VEILSNFQNVKSSCANAKPPIVKTFWWQFCFKSHMLSPDCFIAICVRFLAVWRSDKRVNREPTSRNHLGAFYLTCFVCMCEIFTSVVSHNMVQMLCFNVIYALIHISSAAKNIVWEGPVNDASHWRLSNTMVLKLGTVKHLPKKSTRHSWRKKFCVK